MDNNFTNIDEAFKNAFEHAEASFGKAEMHSDWSKVASQIPAGPLPQTPAPHHILNHFTGGLGKVLGLSGLGAAVVTAAVILYNIYVTPADQATTASNPAVDKTAVQNQAQPSLSVPSNNSTITPQNGASGKPAAKKTVGGVTAEGPSPNYYSQNHFNGVFGQDIPNQGPSATKTAAQGGGNESKPQNGSYTVRKQLKVNISSALICANQAVTVSTIQAGAYTIEWGDGYMGPMSGPLSHSFLKGGRYGIHIFGSGMSLDTLVTVLDKPKANFVNRQAEKLTYNFSNHSVQASRYTWLYDDGTEDNGYNAAHTYPDTGRHLVRLVAYNSAGCSDTFAQYLRVEEFAEPVISNDVVTPNGDNKNDDFYVALQDETSFQLTIVDRTGMIVFNTNDKHNHWTGKNQFTGSDCKPGAYYYSISYSFKQNSEPRVKTGIVSLFR